MLDYMVVEAITLKAKKEEAEANKKAERKEWKRDTGDLKQYQ